MEFTTEPAVVKQVRQKVLIILKEKNIFAQFLYDFGKLKINEERVIFVHKFLEGHKLYPKFVEDSKNNEQSGKYRQSGNEMYKKKNALKAIEFYTKSCALAEKNSENLAIAYANRSAVLFKKEFYNECLKDIERALKNNYPKNLTEKLLKRQENANKLKLISDSEPYHEPTPEISEDEANEFLQSAANCVKKEYTETMGRHIIATRDITVGEIIAIEKPYCSILLKKRLIHCHECLILCYTTIPCGGCTEAVYCSEECKDTAWEGYHKYECNILKMVYMLSGEYASIHVLKLALSVRHLYQEIATGNLEETAVYRSDRYTEVHNLTTNTEKLDSPKILDLAIASAILYHLVKENTDFFEDLENGENIFCRLVLHHNQISACNAISITEIAEGTNNIYSESDIGVGVYPFISLFNHSCFPNTLGIFHVTTMNLYALQNINKGEQLYISYGPDYYENMDKAERQHRLRCQFHFECTCRPCIEDWPLHDRLLPDGNLTLVPINAFDFFNLKRCDVGVAKRLLEEYIPKARLNWRDPCKERFYIEEIMHQCWNILGNRRRTL